MNAALARACALFASLAALWACGDASAKDEPAPRAAPATPVTASPDARSGAGDGALAECEARVAELTAELRRERETRLEREREWLRYTQRMARLTELAGAPKFQPDVPAEEREARALQGAPSAPATGEATAAGPAAPTAAAAVPEAVAEASEGELMRAARLAREERSRAVFLALRSLFAIEHVSGLDLLESGTVAGGATGPVVLRVLDDRGRPLGSLYAERLRLEGSHAAHTLTLVLEQGWERRSGSRTPFEGGPADAEGRGGQRRIELPHVDPAPWFEALPELFREDQRAAVTQGDPRTLTALRFELNRLFQQDASGPVYRLESVTAVEGLVLREVHLAVLTPDQLKERELFADRLSVSRAEKGLEIVLESGSQMRGSEKVPFLEGRYRIFLPRADATRWAAAGIPIGAPAAPAAAPDAATPAPAAPVPAPPGG